MEMMEKEEEEEEESMKKRSCSRVGDFVSTEVSGPPGSALEF